MGDWKLTDAQAKTLREYLLRGGFIMMDDFWNADEYARFDESMRKVFPGPSRGRYRRTRMRSSTPSTIWTTATRCPAGGRCDGGPMTQRAAGTVPHWMGIYDDKARLMVAICFNNDVGDSWEWADEPRYPGEVLGAGDSDRRELRRVFDDALS